MCISQVVYAPDMHTATRRWPLLLLKAITKRAIWLAARPAILSKLANSFNIVFWLKQIKKSFTLFVCRFTCWNSRGANLQVLQLARRVFEIEKVRYSCLNKIVPPAIVV